MICVTEPRRIAAVNLAKRMSEEKSIIMGQEIGYAIRFEDCYTPNVTQIKFVTDGLLIREMMQNPLLPQYSVIILDEVHERNVNTDIILGLLKKVMKKRDDLKLIVCSATVDAEELKLYFDEGEKNKKSNCLSTVILSVEGRYYPIEISYLSEPCDNYINTSVTTALAIHMTQEDKDGDILIFLTGQDEVDTVCSMLIERANDLKSFKNARYLKKLWVLPLYGSLPMHEQLKVFENTQRNTRKIIVATNIAETSLTIHGIGFVIDSGFMYIFLYFFFSFHF
jgi:ATP-dependent RNA helicase DDX35